MRQIIDIGRNRRTAKAPGTLFRIGAVSKEVPPPAYGLQKRVGPLLLRTDGVFQRVDLLADQNATCMEASPGISKAKYPASSR